MYRLSTLLLAILICLAPAGPASAELVGYWTFEQQDATDSSDYGNDGVLYGDATFLVDVPDALSSSWALSTDGSGDYVSIPHSDSLFFEEGVTVSLWVKGDYQDQATGWPRLAAKMIDDAGWNMEGGGDVGTEFLKNVACRIETDIGSYKATSSHPVLDAQWHHLALVLDQVDENGGIWSYYMDGNKLTGSFNGSGLGNTHEMRLASGTTSGRAFRGLLDEVAVFDSAISDEWVQMLADGAAASALPEPGSGILLTIGLLSSVTWRRRRRR